MYSYDRTGAAKDDLKSVLQKWIDQASLPEKELISIAEKLENEPDKSGRMSTVVNYLDEAINAFAKAKGALIKARARLT